MSVAVTIGIGLAITAARYAYHRWFEDKPVEPTPRVQIPHTEEGTPISLIFGKTIVRQPILAWAYVNHIFTSTANTFLLYVLGIGCDDTDATNRVHNMWIGDEKLSDIDLVTGSVDANENWTQTGDGGPEAPIVDAGVAWIETLNGNPSQVLVNDASTSSDAPTYAGRRMLETGVSHEEIPGYRGYLSVFLHAADEENAGWPVSVSGGYAFAFEASSYWNGTGPLSLWAVVGDDMNPIVALYCILKNKFGKLGISTTLIDETNFASAAYTVRTESIGWSRCIDSQASGDEHIQELLRLVDGALDVDQTTGKLQVHLVRPDFSPADLLEINKTNCEKLTGFSFSGWPEQMNRVRVKYTDRDDNYQVRSVASPNQGNAVAQGSDEEVIIEMLGIHERDQAERIAAREAAVLSRPMLKCRALVDRSFLRAYRGMPLRLVWKNPDINAVVRVANADRGTREDGVIALDLIADTFWTWRNRTPELPDLPTPPNPPTVVGG